MYKPKIFIIVLNWNRADDTIECLRSIWSVIPGNYRLKVLVVDNGSTDGSVEKIKKILKGSQPVEILLNKENYGFAAGNNIGIRYALKNNADYIFILNNDTIVDRNIINEFVCAADKYKSTGVFTPKIYFAKGFEFHKKYKNNELGRVIWSAGGSIDWNNVYATNTGVDEVDGGQFNKDRDTDFATGAGMFVRAEVFQKIGVFDERYYMYMEDVDFCQRYIKCGGNIIFINKAIVWHKVARSSGIGSNLNDYYITRNRLLFGMGYAGWRAKIALYRESVKFLMGGRPWQKQGVVDFYTARFGRGSWK